MITGINNYINSLQECLEKLDRKEIDNFIKILLQARDESRTIFIMGNGGSASTASHFCCDFNKGMSYQQDRKFKLICLNDNVATMLAYANDVDYGNVFVEQLKNFFNPGDVVVGISGSGNSKNVLQAIEYANENGGITIGLTGYNGGVLKQISNYSVNANIDDMQISEDIHMMLCHMTYSILMNPKTMDQKELICG